MFISIVRVIKTFHRTCCLCFPVQNWGWLLRCHLYLVEHCFFHCDFYCHHHCQNIIFPIAGWLSIGYDVVCTAPRSPSVQIIPSLVDYCVSRAHPITGEQKVRTRQPGLGQMSPNASRRVSGSPAKLRNSTIFVTIARSRKWPKSRQITQ